MEDVKLEIASTEADEKCESIPKLGESSVSVDGERDEMASLVDRAVSSEGGEGGALENHAAVEDTDSITEAVAELIESSAVVAGEVATDEVITSEIKDLPLDMEVEEEAKRADDVSREGFLTDSGDAQSIDELQVDTRGDELLAEPNPKFEAEGELVAIDDTKLTMNVTDSDAKMGARSDEVPDDPQLIMQTDKEFVPLVHPNVDVAGNVSDVPVVDSNIDVIANVSKTEQLSEFDARENTLLATIEGMEDRDGKFEREREICDEEKIELVGGVGSELVDSCKVENYEDTVGEGDEVNEKKADVLINDPEAGMDEKPAGAEEEKVDHLVSEEIPIPEVKSESEIITEVNDGDQEQVHELSGDLIIENADGKEMADEDSLMFETKTVENEDMDMEVLRDPKSDEPVNVIEDKEDAVVEEELQARDINTETKDRAGAEAEEINLVDAEVETEMGTEVVSDKIPEDDSKMEREETTTSDVDEAAQDIYDSPAPQDEEDEAMVAEEETGTQDTEMETETDVAESEKTSGGKRKRGKLSKSPISKATSKGTSKKTVGEDVCFICFDGGELVLCDRRGCPKAYHPSCVNRDEAFFKSKGRWNCGWHLCSICEKNARYMCFTCTFSLCKSCTKDAVILCVRGNKGFCETCQRTVLLIENNEQGNTDTPVDFDDKSSWEYLFKDYYTELKAKLSLSLDEISEAKNPRKGADMLSGPSKQESSEAQADANDEGSGSDDSVENLETTRPKRRKVRKQSKSISRKAESVNTGVAVGDKAASLSDNSEWASKELLEFVSHMKNGDASFLSQFDVQALLLEYIKRNKLRDPRRKSQIICDARLENLFGKPRVGHFEMLKLLESHFLIRDEQNDDVQGSVVDTENNQLDIDGNAETPSKGGKDKKRKYRKKDSRGPQSNLNDYAAIDMHNIGLIYLRRKLMEDLLEDDETFQDKVVGTFVRIRIPGSQKQDLYRLVPVVGTSKVPEPYKIGKKTTDIMVEILNLDKTDIIPIDTISNQEFTEEECKRLRQSIKCGLISRLTVGEILDKTTEIQMARVNDWLESEVLRLSHLRDRASDLGRRKELRECVEKLQLLKTPEERRRRLEEIPEIHADPKMDPSYESDDKESENEDNRRDSFLRPRGSNFSRRGRGPISPGSDNSRSSSKNWESSRYISGNMFSTNSTHGGDTLNENSWNLDREKDPQESHNLEKLNSANKSESAERALRLPVSRSESFSGITPVSSQASVTAGVVENTVKINESEKMWHYKDPSGKVQGPFSMVQLRKWNNTGYFPADLKIWKNTEKPDNSVLLADALVGKFPKELPPVDNVIPSTNTEQNSAALQKLSSEKWRGNDTINLPSPTPRQSNAGLSGTVQPLGVNGVLPSPTPVLPNIGTHASAPSPDFNSVMQPTAFSPTPNSQQGVPVSQHTQSTSTNEPHPGQIHGHPSAAVQPVQPVVSHNPQVDTQSWGASGQPGQPHSFGWGTANVQNPPGNISNDVWKPTQGSQPNMHHPPATPNASWGMAPVDGNATMGMRPENPNAGWSTMPPNANMGWVNPAPGSTTMNWAPTMQAPPPAAANTTPGWVAPPGNAGANIQGMVQQPPGNIQGMMPGPGNGNPSWVPPPAWVGPGPLPGNGWGPPPGGNIPVQGPPPNQGWGAPPPGNQGPWSGPPHGRDSGFNGGRPWNRQSAFGGGGGGGGGRNKRDTMCPYNVNGRCKKGSRCDYMHS